VSSILGLNREKKVRRGESQESHTGEEKKIFQRHWSFEPGPQELYVKNLEGLRESGGITRGGGGGVIVAKNNLKLGGG